MSAVGTPGRRRISRSGAAGAVLAGPRRRNRCESSFGSGRTPSETSSPATAKSDEPSHGSASSCGVEAAVGEDRAEDERAPDRARDRAEEDDRHPARAALGREHLGRRGAREEHDRLRRAAAARARGTRARRTSTQQPSAVTAGPAMPSTKPPRITGIRPTRSEMRPAGPTASAPAIRNTAGPSPRISSIPVTATIVTVPSATASWIIPERQTSPPRAGSRCAGPGRHRATYASSACESRARNGGRAAVRRVADVRGRRARACASRPTATTRAAARRARAANGSARLRSRRRVGRPVRALARPGCVGTTFQRSDGRPRARAPRATRCTIDAVASAGPVAGQLPLGGERDPGDARAAVAGRLADGSTAPCAVADETLPPARLAYSSPMRAASRSTKPVVIAL